MAWVEARKDGQGNLQSRSACAAVCEQFGLHTPPDQQVVLTVFGDLFRVGYLAWGFDTSNMNPPFFHVTDRGRKALAGFSRDPANRSGYLAHLAAIGGVPGAAQEYIEEALSCFEASCFKAVAVLAGVAAELVAFDVRDCLLKRFGELQVAPPRGLDDWRAKSVLDAMAAVWSKHRKSLGRELDEHTESLWPGLTSQVRFSRNAAGHAGDLALASEEVVHAVLLLFPQIVAMAGKLKAWVATASLS